ncbi:hypothetical protein NJB1507_17200 [Mycobacterium marinum]|uniref:hypothetical protein n=1 Tax=Mycobacterium marinum TaxID=1781 RepID=UPI0021C480B8|nr:hypothetical protein [Mycobacterium marinum]GJO20738.1 hypothetical protein NJB1507_17200 [Mycobacterium marinum]
MAPLAVDPAVLDGAGAAVVAAGEGLEPVIASLSAVLAGCAGMAGDDPVFGYMDLNNALRDSSLDASQYARVVALNTALEKPSIKGPLYVAPISRRRSLSAISRGDLSKRRRS